MLTVDMDLQKRVEGDFEKNLRAFHAAEPMMDRAFVVMMNPKTVKFYQWQERKL